MSTNEAIDAISEIKSNVRLAIGDGTLAKEYLDDVESLEILNAIYQAAKELLSKCINIQTCEQKYLGWLNNYINERAKMTK